MRTTARRGRALAEPYGVHVVEPPRPRPPRRPRDRRRGDRRSSEIIVIGAPRRRRGAAAIFGETVDYVLKNAPCRVMVVAGRRAA